jgi:hypothetical protein
MTREEIKTKYKELKTRLKEAQAQEQRIQLEMEILETHCEHPKAYKVCTMGEMGDYCPDCGWAT